jgi:hypothetical protein
MMTWRDATRREDADGCAAFAAILPDYLDESLAPEAADAARAHIAGCDQCRALVHDLHAIRTRAAALPVLHPSRDLWSGIEARIGPRVAALPGGTVGEVAGLGAARQTALRRWFGPHYATRVAALAAGLIVVTAGVTYLTTRLLFDVGTVTVVDRVPATATSPSPNPVRQVSPAPKTQFVVSANGPARAQTSEYLYDSQIASLHKILEQRRGQLDPKTVAVIERSLRVIDTAIAQSKAALAKDPANGFLADQVDRDLDTKLELLRTVALLPSRT